MTRRQRSLQPGLLSVIAMTLVLELALAVRPLGTRAATPDVESPPSAAQVDGSAPEQPPPAPAGVADVLSLAFIALLWALSNKAARHHQRSIRPRRSVRSPAAIERRAA